MAEERPYKVSLADLEQEQEFHRGHTGLGTPTAEMITQFTHVIVLAERLERIEKALEEISEALRAHK
jgi:hypothetical protein